MKKNESRAVWIFHHYGAPPGEGRFERPCELKKAFDRRGWNASVFFASRHHLLTSSLPPSRSEGYIPIASRAYLGNGVQRILNMCDYSLGLVKTALRRKSEERPDVIVASTPHPLTWLSAWIIAKRFKAKLVLEVRDFWPESIFEFGNVGRFHPVVLVFSWIMKRAYRNSEGIVSLLPGSSRYIEATKLTGLEIEIREICNGVNPELIRRRSVAENPGGAVVQRIQEEKSQGKTLIGYAGAMGPPNALSELIRLQDAVDARRIECSFHIFLVGDGIEREKLELRRSLTENPCFTLLGALEKRQVPAFLNLMELGIICWRESELYKHGVSPNKLWEYFACGLPVIWVGRTSYDPVAMSGAGKSLPPGDPEKLLDAILRWHALSEEEKGLQISRAKQFVEEFGNWRILGENYVDFVEQIVDSSGA